ncbi:MAG: ABC transporter ATP-binding protein [Thermodesulfobacteriota bacterium]
MSDTILQLSNVESSYGAVISIRGVSFSVPEGSIATVLGANGAGKTTILKTISGVIDPDKGSIRYCGKYIQKRYPDWIVRQGICHVPEGRQIFPLLSVYDNLMMGAYTRKDRQNFTKDLDTIYGYFPILKDRTNQMAGELSGGQQQMLAISRALMGHPKLMLLDEPSLGLSPLLTQEIFAIIRRINRDSGTTILLVEQNANMALAIADFGYVLENGRIVLEDTCEALLQHEEVREYYLGQKESGVRGERRWKKKKMWR